MSTSSSSGEPAWAPRPLCEDGLRRRSACGHPMPDLQRDSAFKKMAFELRLYGAHGGSFKRVRRPRRTLRLSGVTNRGEKFGRSRNLVPGEETCKVMRLKVGQQRDLRR